VQKKKVVWGKGAKGLSEPQRGKTATRLLKKLPEPKVNRLAKATDNFSD